MAQIRTRPELRNKRADMQYQNDLVIKARAGDQRAMEELLELINPYLINAVETVTVNDLTDKEDLQQEAYLAVLEAVHKYDLELGETPFTRYAMFHVRKHVSWWLARNSGTLPMPYEAWRTAGQVDEIEDEVGRSLSSDELAEATGKGYARDAADARQRHVQIDYAPEAKLATEQAEELEQDVVEFVEHLAQEFDDAQERTKAALEFCDQYGLDYAIGWRMAHEASNRPGTDDGSGVEDERRRAEKSRDRRR